MSQLLAWLMYNGHLCRLWKMDPRIFSPIRFLGVSHNSLVNLVKIPRHKIQVSRCVILTWQKLTCKWTNQESNIFQILRRSLPHIATNNIPPFFVCRLLPGRARGREWADNACTCSAATRNNKDGGQRSKNASIWVINIMSFKFLSDCGFAVSPFLPLEEASWRILLREYGAHICYTPLVNASDVVKDSCLFETLFKLKKDRPLIAQVRLIWFFLHR